MPCVVEQAFLVLAFEHVYPRQCCLVQCGHFFVARWQTSLAIMALKAKGESKSRSECDVIMYDPFFHLFPFIAPGGGYFFIYMSLLRR